MISASQFAHSHSSFWQSCFPALENYVRLVNSGAYERVFDEMSWEVEPERSALISEVAYCLANPASKGSIAQALEAAKKRLSGLPGVTKNHADLTAKEEEAAKELAHRTLATARTASKSKKTMTFDPEFQGYGAVFKANGDIRANETLIELKAVDRGFRGTDFRQLMTYCLLNSFSRLEPIEYICVINARRGTYYLAKLSEFVFDTSATTFPDIQLRFASAVGAGGTSR